MSQVGHTNIVTILYNIKKNVEGSKKNNSITILLELKTVDFIYFHSLFLFLFYFFIYFIFQT